MRNKPRAVAVTRRAAVGSSRNPPDLAMLLLLLLLATVWSLAACSGGRQLDRSLGDPTVGPQTEDSSVLPTESATPSGDPYVEPTEPTGPTEPTDPTVDTPVPAGEVWEWAFGRNVWEDPILYPLARLQSFSAEDTDIYANDQGFSLTPNADGDVVVVTLFNESTGMLAYEGRLPLGLDWSETGTDLVGMLDQQPTGGWGVPYAFSLQTDDGYDIQIYMHAMHDEDLPTSLMNQIVIRHVG